ARAGLDTIADHVRALDNARREDYEMAKGLLKLPSFNAPDIGPGLLGNLTIDAVEKAMVWVNLGRKYAPPGLLPREQPGPKRLRRAGTTVVFVKPEAYPRFLLQSGQLSISLDSAFGGARGEYAVAVTDVTTDPQITRRPTRFALRRKSSGTGLDSV